jgi:hypothetical protein
VGGAGEWYVDEPGAFVRPGVGQRRLARLLGVCLRSAARCGDAVGCATILRGRGGDPISHAAGSGVLTSGRLEQKAKLARDIDAGKVVPPGLEHTE